MNQREMQLRRAAARAVLLAAHRRFGQKTFRVDPHGPNWKPLHWAADFGWCWFPTNTDRCGILHAGLVEIEPYRANEPRPCVQWICPVCLSVVAQTQGETGLPSTVRCETCAQAGVEAAERMRQRDADGEAAA